MTDNPILVELYKLKISVMALREIIKQLDISQTDKDNLLTNIPQTIVSDKDKQAYKLEMKNLLG